MPSADTGLSRIEDAFLRRDGILLIDADPRNVWVVDQVIIPFDVIIEVADNQILRWAGR